MKAPTNGMTVLFQPLKAADQPLRAQSCAAMICHVNSNTDVNVVWFDELGTPSNASNVQMVQEGDTPSECGYFAEFPAA